MQVHLRNLFGHMPAHRTHSQRRVPRLLTGFEQSRLSWARRAESYTDIPPFYRNALMALVGDSSPFPYIVVTPSYQGYLSPLQEKLVWSQEGHLHVLDRVRDGTVETCYPIAHISWIEVGTVLLQSWLTVQGRAADGVVTTSTFHFNSVSDHVFKPLLCELRSTLGRAGSIDPAAEQAKFDYLNRPAFKFMNYGRNCLLPGESVTATLYQPEIRADIIKMFGALFFQIISPAHLTILTDCELIVIRDADTGRFALEGRAQEGIRYGGVWTYVPLDRIQSVETVKVANNLCELRIGLPNHDQMSTLYANLHETDLNLLAGCLRRAVGHALPAM